ncbi:MAG: hypothetical protein KJZ76_16540 [Burkholderiaceae bacterium]|nr:hypothetical protein [Burkholderiaceae bacterium]
MTSSVDTQSEDKSLAASIGRWKIALTAFGAAAIGAYFTYFGLVVGQPAATDPDKWGTFGDFFGGLMNPIVAFAAFYWLTQSVKLQKQELAETRHELKLAAEAQQQLVVTGKVTVQIAALSALAQEAHNEFLQARTIADAIYVKRPGDEERAFQMHYDSEHSFTLAKLNLRIKQAVEDREKYLAEVKKLLEQQK